MARQFYSRRHYELISNGGTDTADSLAQRKAHYGAFAKLNEEMAVKFPQPWTPEIVAEIVVWQSSRLPEIIREHCSA